MVDSIRKNEKLEKSALQKMKHSLEASRECIRKGGDSQNSSFRVTAQAALVFALGEVYDSVQEHVNIVTTS